MTLSFFGAVRVLVDGWDATAQPTAAPRARGLQPVDAEAWRRWALEGQTDLVTRRPGDRCRLATGERGIVTEVFEAGGWVLACEAVVSLR